MEHKQSYPDGPYPEQPLSVEEERVINEIQFVLFKHLYKGEYKPNKESTEADIAHFSEYCNQKGRIVRTILNKDTTQPSLLEQWKNGDHDVVLEIIETQIEKQKKP